MNGINNEDGSLMNGISKESGTPMNGISNENGILTNGICTCSKKPSENYLITFVTYKMQALPEHQRPASILILNI